ncbi:MAG TPA: hypothetical protein VN515_08510 [Terriglobales bacterium]|nr:hypothetical protein [Terriglobales bacterium]
MALFAVRVKNPGPATGFAPGSVLSLFTSVAEARLYILDAARSGAFMRCELELIECSECPGLAEVAPLLPLPEETPSGGPRFRPRPRPRPKSSPRGAAAAG